jgi:hypothetical protein
MGARVRGAEQAGARWGPDAEVVDAHALQRHERSAVAGRTLVAYQSTESGQDDVHVRPFPEVESGHRRISFDGGSRPVWSPSGQELFYLDGRNRLMTASFQQKPFAIGTPSAAVAFGSLPIGGLARSFDVNPDGQHFIAVRNVAQSDEAAHPNQLRIILNWDEELKRLAPAKR